MQKSLASTLHRFPDTSFVSQKNIFWSECLYLYSWCLITTISLYIPFRFIPRSCWGRAYCGVPSPDDREPEAIDGNKVKGMNSSHLETR